MNQKILKKPYYLLLIGLFFSLNPLNAQKPNIVLILADYIGYADIEPYGAKEIKTPALRRLARNGIRYTDFYSAAPICSPSRAAILTGKYPIRTGLEYNVNKNDNGLTSSQPCLASMLKDAGYATGLIGKWHLGHSEESSPNANGFDTFLGFKTWSIDYYSHKTPSNENGLFYNNSPIEIQGYITDIFTDNAITFINEHKEQPFFLSVFYNATLPPLQRPGNPGDIRDGSTWMNSTRQDYIEVLERLDYGIGQLLDELERNGILENTIVIFTSDHGGKDLVDHGSFSHGFATLWEGGIRVPLIIQYPKLLKKNVVDSTLSINMDLTATLLNAAGITVNKGMDGRDLFSKIQDRALFWNLDFSDSKGRKQQAVREGDWKYLDDNGTDLLFNLNKDPAEQEDLGYQFPGIKDDLKKKLKSWLDQVTNLAKQ